MALYLFRSRNHSGVVQIFHIANTKNRERAACNQKRITSASSCAADSGLQQMERTRIRANLRTAEFRKLLDTVSRIGCKRRDGRYSRKISIAPYRSTRNRINMKSRGNPAVFLSSRKKADGVIPPDFYISIINHSCVRNKEKRRLYNYKRCISQKQDSSRNHKNARSKNGPSFILKNANESEH